jgi:hypothetical protein
VASFAHCHGISVLDALEAGVIFVVSIGYNYLKIYSLECFLHTPPVKGLQSYFPHFLFQQHSG